MPKHITFFALAFTPITAYAYLDPGTGSFILQMLIASVLGGLLYAKLAWDRTRRFFIRLFSLHRKRDKNTEGDQNTGDERGPSP